MKIGNEEKIHAGDLQPASLLLLPSNGPSNNNSSFSTPSQQTWTAFFVDAFFCWTFAVGRNAFDWAFGATAAAAGLLGVLDMDKWE
jgi:hypothetical protein